MDTNFDIKKIKDLYENLTYFDQYGSSLILIILVTIVFVLAVSYCVVMSNFSAIKSDWPNQRCNPKVMPFAGLINKPDDMSVSQFTSENFSYCSQTIISNGTGELLSPLTSIMSSISSGVDKLKNSLNSVREITNQLRSNLANVSQEIMGRLINVGIPIQQIVIVFRDIMSKVQGILTASFMTVLGSYYALRALLGSIVEIILKTLLTMSILLYILFLIPFSWPIALPLSAFFVVIAIYMTIIIIFLTITLKIEPTMSIPKVNRCFDKNTLLTMNDKTQKPICDINVGDILSNSNKVTAIFKLDATGTQMYDLNGVVVSGTHQVLINGKWIPVTEHKYSTELTTYNEKFIYCLNTSTKQIIINGIIFSDWDEVHEDDILSMKKDIHIYMDGGFSSKTQIKLRNDSFKYICEIQPGDILANNEKVYGVVVINGAGVTEQCKYNLGNSTFVEGGPNLTICDKSVEYVTTLDINDKVIKSVKENRLYHILTDTKTLNVNNVCFYDYNATLELFMNKYRDDLLKMRYN